MASVSTEAPVLDQPSDWEREHERTFLRWMAVLLALGLFWRFLRYFLRFPIWGDEAMLAVNFLDRGYLDLTRSLDHCQIAPVLFLWSELTVYRLLGSSELALRLLPFLAGLGSLALLARLAWLVLTPLGRALAVGMLAVSIWPVSMGTLMKPYAFDLLFALVILVLALEWLRRPGRLRWLVLLVLVTPVAVLASYPVVFVGGGAALALLPAVWRGGSRQGWALYLLFVLGLAGTFAGHYLLVSVNHLASVSRGGASTAADMRAYWADAFPPAGAWPLVRWLALAHTGQMMAYPTGAASGGSIVTFVLFVLGLAWAWRRRRWALLALLLAPFVLGLVAAFLGKYPYGSSCRLAQFQAPSVILLASAGICWGIHRCTSGTRGRLACLHFWMGLFVVVGLGGIARDLYRPYRSYEYVWIREVADTVVRRLEPGTRVVLLNDVESLEESLRWYLASPDPTRVCWQASGEPAPDACLLLWEQKGPDEPSTAGRVLGLRPGGPHQPERFFLPLRETNRHVDLYCSVYRRRLPAPDRQAARGNFFVE